MRVKILHILHSLQVGGLENGVVNLINRLDPERFEHAICCIATSGPMADRIERRVPIHVIGKGAERDTLLPFKIARVVRAVRPHIVHTRNWGTIDGVPGALFGGVRCIVHGEHGREATDPTGTNRRRQQVRRLLSPLISRFITVSTDLRNWLVDDVGVNSGKVLQIINGVDMERFRPSSDQYVRRNRTGFPPEVFVIGTVGRLDPVKDHQLLIRAFALVKQRMSGADRKLYLRIVGDGPERERLAKVVNELGVGEDVLMVGERRDIPDQLQMMDLFVLPSIAEGISNTLLEAMAIGLPVIASAVGGNCELIEDGMSGYLFPPGDVERLSSLLEQCIGDGALAQQLGRAARRRCEECFSLDAMASAYGQMYEDLARRLR